MDLLRQHIVSGERAVREFELALIDQRGLHRHLRTRRARFGSALARLRARRAPSFAVRTPAAPRVTTAPRSLGSAPLG